MFHVRRRRWFDPSAAEQPSHVPKVIRRMRAKYKVTASVIRNSTAVTIQLTVWMTYVPKIGTL